jgi:hypothetical protein
MVMDINEYIEIAAKAYTSVQEQPLVAEDMQRAIRFGAELTKQLLNS